MRKIQRSIGGARVVAVLASGFVVLGAVQGAHADLTASRKCRGALGTGFSGAIVAGFKASDTCHKAADKAAQASGDCNDHTKPAFDPKGKYVAAKTKANTLIGNDCKAGDPVLNNYDGMNPPMAVLPFIDTNVDGNSLLVVGSANLNGDKVKRKCLETIGRFRTLIIQTIVKNSVKCQAGMDKTGTTFDAIDPACIDNGSKVIPKATAAIDTACAGIAAGDIGACAGGSLDSCVTDNAKKAATLLAEAIFHKKAEASTCGNGLIEDPEQCDDGAANGTPGDLCDANCNLLTETCGPGTTAGGSIIGHRVLTVSLNIPNGPGGPQQLAGVTVGFDYPQPLASIKGTGTSDVVQSAVNFLQTVPPGTLALANDDDTQFSETIASGSTNFMSSGPLFTVTLDECVSASVHTCSRSQNVIGCCPSEDVPACQADPTNPMKCFCDAIGSVTAAQCSTASCTTGVCPAGGVLDSTTCEACPTLPGCFNSFNPPACKAGHFPAEAVGMCDGTSSGPVTGCPSNNDCISQVTLTSASCNVTDPVDQLARHIDGVTCSIAITEMP